MSNTNQAKIEDIKAEIADLLANQPNTGDSAQDFEDGLDIREQIADLEDEIEALQNAAIEVA